MKQLLPLILLCALLCGCAGADPSDEPQPVLPTESVAGTLSEPEEYGGAVQTVPLNLRKVRGLRIFRDDLLLFSGQGSTTLTLLDRNTLKELACITLEYTLEQDDPSLVLHPGGTISFFDPLQRETILLDSSLREIRRIPAPGALSGIPILSEDASTLFYCTASHVRAWELESGIHRCVKEMAFDSQTLTGVLLGGKILQCQTFEDSEIRTLILSSSDGRLLHQIKGELTLTTAGSRYCASLPAGSYRTLVFGAESEAVQMLSPADLTAKAFLLPALQAIVTASVPEDGQPRLDYYDLPTGLRPFRLSLGPYQLPRAIEALDGDTLVILTYDPALDRELLLFWELEADSPQASQTSPCYTSPYYTADAPDTQGLALCQQQADRLGNRYGIHILLGEAAAAVTSRSFHLEPEHQVGILQAELEALEQRLSRYPQTLLRDTAAHFSSMNLCLVREVSAAAGAADSAAGTQFLDGTDAYLVIPTGTLGAQALYHQLFHLMEVHIFSNSKAFDRWEEWNPAGFRYDYDYAANARRDSGVYLFEETRSFVDTFSMSYPREDRARIMEYAMLPGNEALFQPIGMQKKLRQLCIGIREAYGLDSSDTALLWEQYLH